MAQRRLRRLVLEQGSEGSPDVDTDSVRRRLRIFKNLHSGWKSCSSNYLSESLAFSRELQ